jgi:SAM-dependent methyltransferase
MIVQYYDQLAIYYRYLFSDWEKSVPWHAQVINGVIQEFFGGGIHHILDVACGIGTQCLGLAQIGYQVTASDISIGELALARKEAAKRSLKIQFAIADMRDLRRVHQDVYDLVIACDNAVPHLLTEADILRAFEQFYHCTPADGGCIISVRDYENMDLEPEGRIFYPRTTHLIPDGRVILFDIWEFDGPYYDFTTYVVEDRGGETANTHIIRGGRYFCVTIPVLERLLKQAGFPQVAVLRGRYHQPILVGKKNGD